MLTLIEKDLIIGSVVNKNAKRIVEHIFKNPVSSSRGLTKVAGRNASSLVRSSINNRIDHLGFRISHNCGTYSFIRIPVESVPLVMPACMGGQDHRWIMT